MSTPALTHDQVLSILPHRPPLLLIDEVLSLNPLKEIQASLWLDPAWDLFHGHFPSHPIFPGVLSVETMAQAADIMIMTSDHYAGKTPLFASIQEAAFKRPLYPGDQLTVKAKVIKIEAEKAKILCQAEILTPAQELAATATLTIAMR